MIARIGILALAAAAALGGCGGSDDEDSGATRYVATCNNICMEAARCSSTVDETQCSTDCQDQLATTGPNLNAQFLAEYDACAASGDCAALVVEAIATNTCANRARIRTDPTPTLESFCDAVREEDDRCGRPDRRPICIEVLKIFSDAALSRARACLSEACDQQQPCVEQELGTNLG